MPREHAPQQPTGLGSPQCCAVLLLLARHAAYGLQQAELLDQLPHIKAATALQVLRALELRGRIYKTQRGDHVRWYVTSKVPA